MSKEDVADKLKGHYQAYCRANDLTPDGEFFDAFCLMALERIEELLMGDYTLEDAITQYIDAEATDDIVFLKRRL